MKNLILILFIGAALASCNDVTIETPDFNVTSSVAATDGDTVKISLGDTILFNFTGDPDYITFYSGQSGHDYNYSGTTQRSADSSVISFSTNLAAGNQGTLICAASNDYSGATDTASIHKATWVDITSNFKLATTSTTVMSGSLNLNNVTGITKNTPVYIAFKYLSDTVTSATTIPRKWIVNAFSFKSYVSGTANVLANDFRSGGFSVTSVKNSSNYWLFANASLTFTVNSNLLMLETTRPDEDWAISRSLDMRVMANDVGVVVKSLQNTTTILSYTYLYPAKGVFTATFIAQNQDSETSKQVVRKIIVKVQ